MDAEGSVGPDTILSVAQRVAEADSLDDAVLSIVDTLRDEFSLWRATVAMAVPGRWTYIRFVSVWSATDTILDTGTEIPISSTLLPRVLESGGPVSVAVPAQGLPEVFSEILRNEGIQSAMAIPLARRGRVVGMLVLSSAKPAAFDAMSPAFFRSLGRGIEASILDLVTASGRLG